MLVDVQQMEVMACLDARPQVLAIAVADLAEVLEVSWDEVMEKVAVAPVQQAVKLVDLVVLVQQAVKLVDHAFLAKEREACHLPSQELQRLRGPLHRL